MSRPLDRERYDLLSLVAHTAKDSLVFAGIDVTDETLGEHPRNVSFNRALLALIAADELGLSLIDALNRVRFTDQGLSFAPAVDATFEDVLRRDVASAQKDAKKTEQKADAPAFDNVTNAERVLNIPQGFVPEGKPVIDCSPGELAFFIEEAQKKGAFLDVRTFAWKVLSWKIPTSTALELGKLTRWILNKAHLARKEYFNDVLVAAEARLEELGEKAVQP